MKKNIITTIAAMLAQMPPTAEEAQAPFNPSTKLWNYQPGGHHKHKSRKPMNHAAAKRAKIKRRNKRLHPRGCK